MNASRNFFVHAMDIGVGVFQYVIRGYCNLAVSDGQITITNGTLSAGLSSDHLLFNFLSIIILPSVTAELSLRLHILLIFPSNLHYLGASLNAKTS